MKDQQLQKWMQQTQQEPVGKPSIRCHQNVEMDAADTVCRPSIRYHQNVEMGAADSAEANKQVEH